MSLVADVAIVLRTPPASLIAFKVETITVDKAAMESVAKAIEQGDIALDPGSAGSQLGAAYSSFMSRRWGPSERKLIGKLTLGSPNVVKSAVGKAGIYHECTHALMDVKGHKVSMQNDEVVAYLADAMYLKKTMTRVSGGAAEMAIYGAAYAIIDAHHMLTKPGVRLKWTDCDALRTAIKAIPAYQ